MQGGAFYPKFTKKAQLIPDLELFVTKIVSLCATLKSNHKICFCMHHVLIMYFSPRPRISILFQLRRKIGCQNGVKFLGVVPFWLYFSNFGRENSRFGTTPRILLVLLTPPKIGTQSVLLPQLKQQVQGAQSLCLDMLNYFCFHVYTQNSLSHSFTLSFTHSWHAEQLLFSCLCSKVSVYRWKWQCFFGSQQQHHPIPWHSS